MCLGAKVSEYFTNRRVVNVLAFFPFFFFCFSSKVEEGKVKVAGKAVFIFNENNQPCPF